MYGPKHFQVDDPATLHALMRANPLATVVQHSAEGLVANHIPLHLVQVEVAGGAEWRLRGHVARGNPLWRDAQAAPEVLLVFADADAYVSPNWYPSKAVDHRAVPTWNYAVVHVRGVVTVHDDVAWLRAFLTDLTAEHERGQAQPWQLSDAPEDYLASMLRAVVGIEVAIESMQGKWKVSQNHSAENRAGVVAGMRGVQDDAHGRMADWVEQAVK